MKRKRLRRHRLRLWGDAAKERKRCLRILADMLGGYPEPARDDLEFGARTALQDAARYIGGR